jgi:beta-glucosidase
LNNVQVQASIVIKNSGAYPGAEVSQAYISFPESADEPPKVLRGFEKVLLNQGEQRQVNFSFGKTELSYWDTARGEWVVPTGEFKVLIGSSSRKIHATLPFQL